MEVRVLAWFVCLSVVSGCLVDDKYNKLTPEDLVSQLQVIVYGEVIDFVQGDPLTDATFRVFCIIKGNTTILENITVEGVSPRSACSGTYVYWVKITSNFEKTGAVMILGLRETKGPGLYEFHEINDLQSSAFDDNSESWKLINSVVKTEMFPPINSAVNKCPEKSDQRGPEPDKNPVASEQGGNSSVRTRLDIKTVWTMVILGTLLWSRDL
ncbi:uncharacterized protein LOC133194336 [Saccostrea echinata]|uniref:uncharacterized protein LOC133194336 n=1 Tax=Saccostrea echinata TaxID=191078 RepID=UPI002A83855A|nr:uncharacterized protein LOC133194336 [Saccostrea echinata]